MEGPRAARPEEIEDLTDLVDTIFGFSYYQHGYMVAGMRRDVMQTGHAMFDGGKPVSYILSHDTAFSLCGCTTHVTSVGCVGTRKDYRNQGLAGTILTHHIARARAAGARLMLVSGSRPLYTRNHCVYTNLAFWATLTPEQFPAPAEGLSIRRVTLEDWPTLAPLYQAEPAHFVRPADVEQHLCFWWNCGGSRLWLVEHQGEPVAYMELAVPRDPARTGRHVQEYAGSRAALLGAVPLLFAENGGSEIEWGVLRQDRELRLQLTRLGTPLEEGPVSGTVRLLDLPGLMSDLHDYVAARLTPEDLARLSFDQEGDACRCAFAGEELQVDPSAAVRIVLGSPDAPHVKGELGRVLNRLFPLPTIQPGLNYV
jgi:predicted N-acetyltransferase YhbS